MLCSSARLFRAPKFAVGPADALMLRSESESGLPKPQREHFEGINEAEAKRHAMSREQPERHNRNS